MATACCIPIEVFFTIHTRYFFKQCFCDSYSLFLPWLWRNVRLYWIRLISILNGKNLYFLSRVTWVPTLLTLSEISIICISLDTSISMQFFKIIFLSKLIPIDISLGLISIINIFFRLLLSEFCILNILKGNWLWRFVSQDLIFLGQGYILFSKIFLDKTICIHASLENKIVRLCGMVAVYH